MLEILLALGLSNSAVRRQPCIRRPIGAETANNITERLLSRPDKDDLAETSMSENGSLRLSAQRSTGIKASS